MMLTKIRSTGADTVPENDNDAVNTLFPVFIKLEELQLFIAGGGSVGYEKLSAVLKNSPRANVTLVAPEIKEEIYALGLLHPNVRLEKREFVPEDLENKDLVICATGDKLINSFIYKEAKRRKILINTADTPGLCDFYLSSVVQKGSIKIAVSTNGKSPTVAKRLKEVLSEFIPDEMEKVLSNLVKIRASLKGNFTEKVKTLNEITSVLTRDLKI